MHSWRRQFSVVVGALLLDHFAGDPPNEWHPVAWMGTLIGRLRQDVPKADSREQFLSGGLIAFGGGAFVACLGKLVLTLPDPLRWLVETAVLKSTFSLSGLTSAASDVETALNNDDIVEARRWLSWHLVSRDTSELDDSQVAAATIESLSENLSDGVIAPLFFYRFGGLPAALAYRYMNTCDAMLGYRDAEREWLGKIPARTDDLLNLIPARLTAAGILGVAAAERVADNLPVHEPVDIYLRDCGQTDSPNAGHPMSATAGALGVELEKVGQYNLGAGLARPKTADIRRAISLMYKAATLCLAILFLFRRGRRS